MAEAGVDESGFDPSGIERADPVLLRYFLTLSAMTLIAFPFVFIPHYFKYRTLRYRFDEEGVSMAWGVLFKREINLTYRRIQDIHVTRNVLERWMGLAKVSVQTASGSSSPEMVIEGVPQADELRDYLYARMRGARGEIEGGDKAGDGVDTSDEALQLLREIRDGLAGMRGNGGAREGDGGVV